MDKTIHIPIEEVDKEKLRQASKIEKLKVCSFVRRIALFEAERIIENSKNKSGGIDTQ